MAGRLMPGERVLWEGAPEQGVRFRAADIPITIFGLFFLGISLIFVVGTFPFGLLLPHFWVGVYLVGGRHLVEARVRSRTQYVVTDQRAVIVRTWPRSSFRTANLRAVSEVEVEEHGNGRGTILFGASPFGTASRSLQFGNRRQMAFERIEHPHHVMGLIQGSVHGGGAGYGSTHLPPPPPPPIGRRTAAPGGPLGPTTAGVDAPRVDPRGPIS